MISYDDGNKVWEFILVPVALLSGIPLPSAQLTKFLQGEKYKR